MSRLAIRGAIAVAVIAPLVALSRGQSSAAAAIPAPIEVSRPAPGLQTIVLAGGCFWGIEAV